MSTNRKETLLRAAFDLLKRCADAHFVLEASCVTVFYDEAECDGGCLMEDIAHELRIDVETQPIPEQEEE